MNAHELHDPDRVSRDRRGETRLAVFTLLALVFYVPAETWYSRSHLLDPGYLVDAIAMVLLFAGALRSLRVRPRSAIAPLAAAWGWTACLGWRSYFARRASRERGLAVYEEPEWVESLVGGTMLVGLAAFAWALVLAYRARP